MAGCFREDFCRTGGEQLKRSRTIRNVPCSSLWARTWTCFVISNCHIGLLLTDLAMLEIESTRFLGSVISTGIMKPCLTAFESLFENATWSKSNVELSWAVPKANKDATLTNGGLSFSLADLASWPKFGKLATSIWFIIPQKSCIWTKARIFASHSPVYLV